MEGLLEIASLDMTKTSVGAGAHSKSWRQWVQIVGAATLKLRAPN